METRTCISCGHEFSGNYCNNCGEKVIRKEDRKLKHFLGEFVNAITFADSKLWRTIKSILIKPGQFSRDFVEGKRKAYMKPISLFFLANLIYFLFPLFNTFNTTLKGHTNPNNFFLHTNVAEQMVQERIDEMGVSFAEYAITFDAKTNELSKLLLILMALMFALLLALFHSRKKHLLSDHLTISIELMTFVLLFAVQLQALIIYLLRITSLFNPKFSMETLISGVSIALLIYCFLRMEVNFYKAGIGRAILNTVLSVVSFVIVLTVYRAILFFVTFWVI